MVKLSDKTVLANFSISCWSGYRFDAKATGQVHQANSAERGSGNFNKRLLAKGAASQIDSIIQSARAYHTSATLPWLDDGVRILPATKYTEYASSMKTFRQDFEEAVAEFIKDYPAHIKTAKAKLGKLYNEGDYPTPEALKDRYRWSMTILPFPDVADFRADVADLGQIQADMQSRMEEVWRASMEDIGKRIAATVSHMSERLKSYKPGRPGKRTSGTFHESLVGNVRELVELLPAFNLTGDKKLAAIIDKMQAELCKHDVRDLRDDSRIRAKVATSADAVLTAVADFIA